MLKVAWMFYFDFLNKTKMLLKLKQKGFHPWEKQNS